MYLCVETNSTNKHELYNIQPILHHYWSTVVFFGGVFLYKCNYQFELDVCTGCLLKNKNHNVQIPISLHVVYIVFFSK